MARVSESSPLHGARGKLKNIVLRTRNGRTYICAAPGPRKGQTTELQQKVMNQFSYCSRYASNAIHDPATRALYEEEAAATGSKIYNLAFSAAMQAFREGCYEIREGKMIIKP